MYKTRGKRVRLVFEFIAPRTITLAETVEFIEEQYKLGADSLIMKCYHL